MINTKIIRDFVSNLSNRYNQWILSMGLFKLALLIFLISSIVKIIAAFTSIAPIYPDEVMQTVEVAHRYAFGTGSLPWEFVQGVRSVVFPKLISYFYLFFDAAGISGGLGINIALKVVLGLLHGIGAVFVFLIIAGRIGASLGFLFGCLYSLHYLSAYIAVRTLTESVAIPFLIAALFFADRFVSRERGRYALLAGIMCGIALMLRLQTAVFSAGLFLGVLVAARRRWSGAGWFFAGSFILVLIQGAVDFVSWGSFFHSARSYISSDTFRGVASLPDVLPASFYIKRIFNDLPIIEVCGAFVFSILAFRSRRDLLLVIPTLLFMLFHLITPLKQVRFIFPVYVLIPMYAYLLCGIYMRFSPNIMKSVLITILLLVSLVQGFLFFYPQWDSSQYSDPCERHVPVHEYVRISALMGNISDISQGYIMGLHSKFSGGYAYFHKHGARIDSYGEPEKFKGGHEVLRREIQNKRDGVYVAIRKWYDSSYTEFSPYLIPYMETKEYRIYKFSAK